jgi:hypothetical protein
VRVEPEEGELAGFKYIAIKEGYKVFRGQVKPCASVGSGFASDFRTANKYGQDPCCYKFAKPAKLLFLDQDGARPLVSFLKIKLDGSKSSICTWNPTEQGFRSLIRTLEHSYVHRRSYMSSDTSAVKALCETFFHGKYDGYYAPRRSEDGEERAFHRELVLCYPEEFLVECFENNPSLEESLESSAKSDARIVGKARKPRVKRGGADPIGKKDPFVTVKPNTYKTGVHNVHVLCEDVPKMTRAEAEKVGITSDEHYMEYLKQRAVCVDNFDFN